MSGTENYEVDNPDAKATLRSIASKVGGALKAGWGFALFIYEYGPPGGALFYMSSAERADVAATLREWLEKQDELNSDHPTVRALRGNWRQVAALLLWKAGRDATITSADIAAFAATGPLTIAAGQPNNTDPDALRLRLVSQDEAARLAAQDKEQI